MTEVDRTIGQRIGALAWLSVNSMRVLHSRFLRDEEGILTASRSAVLVGKHW